MNYIKALFGIFCLLAAFILFLAGCMGFYPAPCTVAAALSLIAGYQAFEFDETP